MQLNLTKIAKALAKEGRACQIGQTPPDSPPSQTDTTYIVLKLENSPALSSMQDVADSLHKVLVEKTPYVYAVPKNSQNDGAYCGYLPETIYYDVMDIVNAAKGYELFIENKNACKDWWGITLVLYNPYDHTREATFENLHDLVRGNTINVDDIETRDTKLSQKKTKEWVMDNFGVTDATESD